MANFMLLRGLVRDFGYWLQGPKDDAEGRKARIEHYQKKLQDEGAIDGLKEQDVQDLLLNLWNLGALFNAKAVVDSILRQNGLDKLKEWLKDIFRRGERGLTPQDFDELLKGVKGVGSSILSELLCLRFPNRYWIWNRVTEMAAEELRKIGAWQFQTVKGTNGQRYFAWKPLQDEIHEALRERQPSSDYFDADMFCWWLSDKERDKRRIWRIAPGEQGEWWEECKKNGCIVIGWDMVAKRVKDFRNLRSKEELKKLFQQAYGRRKGRGGWSQVWDFVHEVQPGNIIVAKEGIGKIIGIGIVTSDCIPPGHPDHPLGDEHELRHARRVDWRITESVQVNGLGRQTVTRENRWDDIVAAYRAKGIDVYERLWGNQQPSLVHYLKAKGFQFDEKQVAAFYASLKTKGFVILSGLSGTGKTKLAQLFAELLCPKCGEGKQDKECTHLFLSVRPDWRDSKALLGYYNPLTERYESTPLLEFLLRAASDYEQNKDNAQPYFVILDEMNLAHVEYYFADFLSVLESGRDEEGWTKEALRLHSFSQSLRDQDGNEIPPTLPLPPNLYIIGTVNIDETTYMFSPKVLDRAFTLEFREVNFSTYPPKGVDEEEAMRIAEQIRGEILDDLRNGGKFCAMVADKDKVREALQNLGDKNKKAELEKLNGILQPYDLHFGYRVLDEIALFVQNAINAPDVIGKLGEDEEKAKDKTQDEEKAKDKAPDKALDYAVLMKVLPKFHGPRQKLENALWQVLNWCLQSQQDSDKPDELLRKIWNQVAGEEKQPSGSDIATQLGNWKSVGEKFRYPNTAKKVLQMLRQLYETGFASFAQ